MDKHPTERASEIVQPPRPKGGQKTQYTPELADTICARLADGESLSSVCREPGMPSMQTVFKWLSQQPAFADNYARAREQQYEKYADEIADIADDGTNDYVEKQSERGVEVVCDHEHIQRSKLRVDTRKWILARMLPKRYGDKMSLEHTGKDGGPIETKALREELASMEPGRLKSFIEQTERQMAMEGGNGAVNGNGKH